MSRGSVSGILAAAGRFVRRRLFLKFVLATLGIGTLANGVVLGIYYQHRQAQVIGEASAEIATVASRIIRPVTGYLAAGETRPARDLLAVFAAFAYVICADVEAADGSVAASWPAIGCARINRAGDDVRLPLPEADGGHLLVRYDRERVLAGLHREFLILAALALIGGLAIVLPALVTFFWIINRPLARLLAAIETFKRHEVATQVDYAAGDEIGQVIQSYNKMLELEVQRVAEVRDAHNAILESVSYASRIQRGLLPAADRLQNRFADLAVVWEPRDVVGGDIYWISPPGPRTTVAVLDCTGHGVPGALLTMVAVTTLERIVAEAEDLGPAAILARLNQLLRRLLNQESGPARNGPAFDGPALDGPAALAAAELAGPALAANDGLDAAICQIDAAAGSLVFAGARLSMLALLDGEVRRLRGDKMSIGYTDSPPDHQFAETTLPLVPGMRVVVATDGVTDQIGGARRRAFGQARLRDFLAARGDEPLPAMVAALAAALDTYAAGEPRRDDLTILAFEPRLG